jgi:hypothetical protein
LDTKHFNQTKSDRKWRIILAVLILLAALSTARGLEDAFKRSQDFQWSGARLLLLRVDPWQEFLNGDPHHQFHFTQFPSYLPLLYILIAPLAFMPLLPAQICWSICNIGFVVLSVTLSARFYGMSRRWWMALLCLMLIATPTRSTIGNGQQGLLVLALWCLSLLSIRLTNMRAAIGGISYVKFNFGPPLFLYLLFRGGLRAVLWSGAPAVVGSVLVWLWLPGTHTFQSFIHFFVKPLAVSRLSYFPNGSDNNLMDVVQTLIFWVHPTTSVTAVNLITVVTSTLVCIAAFYFAFYRHRGSSIQWQMALVGTLGYALFRHHRYDEIVLLFPMCYTLILWREKGAKIVLLILGFHWYAQRLLEAFKLRFEYLYILQFVMLMVAAVMIYQLRTIEEQRQLNWSPESNGRSALVSSSLVEG